MRIVVSEPWNFQSSDGDNILELEVLSEDESGIIAKALSEYEGNHGERLLITKRNNGVAVNVIKTLPNGELLHVITGDIVN